MEKIGIIALAFGLHLNRAGPSNEAIARVALRIKRATGGVLAAQGEVARAFADIRNVDYVISAVTGVEYIDAQEAIRRSLDEFGEEVATIILVAHPLHLWFIRLLLETEAWKFDPRFRFSEDYVKEMRVIPYDQTPTNTLWWTRGPIRFVAYSGKVALTKRHGA